MRFDLPYFSWTATRQLPVFALVVTLVFAACTYFARSWSTVQIAVTELAFTLDAAKSDSSEMDTRTQFELIRFRVVSSPAFVALSRQYGTQKNPEDNLWARFESDTNTIQIGFIGTSPQVAQTALKTASELFIDTATRIHTPAQIALDVDTEQTTSVASVLTVVAPMRVIQVSSLRNMQPVYLALLSFSIFCGLVAILILDMIDTVIRRPHDLETTLGIQAFGVIPPLKLQPIKAKR